MIKFLILLLVITSTPQIQSHDETQNVERDFGYVEEKLQESREEQIKGHHFDIKELD